MAIVLPLRRLFQTRQIAFLSSTRLSVGLELYEREKVGQKPLYAYGRLSAENKNESDCSMHASRGGTASNNDTRSRSLKRCGLVFGMTTALFLMTAALILSSQATSRNATNGAEVPLLLPQVPTSRVRELATLTASFVDSVASTTTGAISGVGTTNEWTTKGFISSDFSKMPYQVGPVCHSCVWGPRSGICGVRTHSYQVKFNMTLAQAAERTANELAKMCERCNPQYCNETEKLYWRLDQVAPPTRQAVTHYLSSIPESKRLPTSALENFSGFFDNPANLHTKDHSYFFEYNPSVVVLPESQRPNITGSIDVPVYLASFRVTDLHNCYPSDITVKSIGGSWPRPPHTTYLGFALLRRDLSIITDTLVQLSHTHGRRWEDCRIFALQEQLYVASFENILPLFLVPPVPNVTSNGSPLNIVNLFSVGKARFPVYAREQNSCVRAKHGKNINFFVDDEGSIIAEHFPMSIKERLQPMESASYCESNRKGDFVANASDNFPLQSFGTLDELHFHAHQSGNLLTGNRGGACCVKIQHPATGKDLLLGISHSKVRFQGVHRRNLPGNITVNHFFSNFYAMETKAPYLAVAFSGKFCLGFAVQGEAGGNPYLHTRVERLRVGEHYNCPAIHFVSGMTEVADNPNRIIVAYGIADCTARTVVLDKSDIVRMLFPELAPDRLPVVVNKLPYNV